MKEKFKIILYIEAAEVKKYILLHLKNYGREIYWKKKQHTNNIWWVRQETRLGSVSWVLVHINHRSVGGRKRGVVSLFPVFQLMLFLLLMNSGGLDFCCVALTDVGIVCSTRLLWKKEIFNSLIAPLFRSNIPIGAFTLYLSKLSLIGIILWIWKFKTTINVLRNKIKKLKKKYHYSWKDFSNESEEMWKRLWNGNLSIN